MAPDPKAAPQQHKQPSRKGKKAWRKNIDVTDIQEGLDKVRDEVITGGVIAEKRSDELFTLDTTGSQEIQRAYNKIHKPLKADQILAQRSAVPSVDTRKRPGITDGVIERKSKRSKANGVKPSEYERLKRRAYGGEAVLKDVVALGAVPGQDPWAPDEEKEDPRFSFLAKKKKVKAPKTLREAPISLLEGKKKLPAVLKPKPGTSYNPVFEDWDSLLVDEGEKEVLAERKRIAAAKAEEERLAKIAAAQDDRDDLMTEDESAWEGFESEFEQAELHTTRRYDRKTPAERNRINRRKKAEQEARHLAATKRKLEQEKQIKAVIALAAAKKEEEVGLQKIEVQSSDEEIDDRVLRRRGLGKTRVPERNLELVLPEELQESLRLLKPEGNLLKDRFRNLMLQGKLETRKPISQPKKARRATTEKWTYKDFTISA